MSRSAAKIEIVPARAWHVRGVARRMREADRIEVSIGSGMSPAGALIFSLRKSDVAYTVLINGRPEIMFGAGDVNILGGVGAPWLLGTDAVERHFRQFLRRSIYWRGQLLARYPVLRNAVHDENTASVRWLRWLGFTLSEPVDFRGHPFRLFELRADHV